MGLLFRLSAKYELLKVGYPNLLQAYYPDCLVDMNHWTLDILIYYGPIILMLWFVWFPDLSDSLILLISWFVLFSDFLIFWFVWLSDFLICLIVWFSDFLICLIVWFFWLSDLWISWFVWLSDLWIVWFFWFPDSSDCLILLIVWFSDFLIPLFVWFFWFFWFQQISNQTNSSAAIPAVYYSIIQSSSASFNQLSYVQYISIYQNYRKSDIVSIRCIRYTGGQA